MSTNHSVGHTKSMPCIEVPFTENTSCHSLPLYKCFNTGKIDQHENHSGIKVLKPKSLPDKLLDSKLIKFNIELKSFKTACEMLNTAYKDCKIMQDDTKRVEDVKNFVKNYMFETFTTPTLICDHFKSQQLDHIQISKTVNFNFKTGMPEMDKIINDMGRNCWETIINLININQVSQQYLMHILQDTQTFQSYEDVLVHVALALKKGKIPGFIGSELIASYKECLKNISKCLNDKLNEEHMKTSLSKQIQTKLCALRNELAENKRSTQIAMNKISLLQKEKRDLLNILKSFDKENMKYVFLEKRIRVEQENNEKLRSMIDLIRED